MGTDYLVWVAFRRTETCFGYPAEGCYGWADLDYMPLAIVARESAADAVVDALALQFNQDAEQPEFYWNPADDYRSAEFLHYKADVQAYQKCRTPGVGGAAAAWVQRAMLLADAVGGKAAEGGNGRRGRPKDPFTQSRADHAKRLVAERGWGWQDAEADYRRQEPADTDVTVNRYRKAYERVYPPD